MYIIKKLFLFAIISTILAACTGMHETTRKSEYDDSEITAPSSLIYGTYTSSIYGADNAHSIAVLLPTSGPNASVGESIRTAVEAAVMQHASSGTTVNFYDTGTDNVTQTITKALESNPEIIIGPVFAKNAKILRELKPSDVPALSFTSDTSAVGNGVISMSLMPTNMIESTIQEMKANGASKFIVIAPNNTSGQIMAGAAKDISRIYDIKSVGILYYQEHDTESIKNTAMDASMYTARSAANTRAKEILSAVINHESLSQTERYSAINQIEKLKKNDVLGKLPYDSILFLGNGDDTKSLMSFMRYYGLTSREAKVYGTPIWEESNIASDITMIGASYATLPDISGEFESLYTQATPETTAPRMAAIGYDATMLAIGALRSRDDLIKYITNPSGYVGTSGLFRLFSDGINERAMQIVYLNGDGTTKTVKSPAAAFTLPIYSATLTTIPPAPEIKIVGNGINPMDYIRIPERLRGKYRSKTYGANQEIPKETSVQTVTILPDNTNDFSITAEDYQPVPLENVSRTYIDSVEISE